MPAAKKEGTEKKKIAKPKAKTATKKPAASKASPTKIKKPKN